MSRWDDSDDEVTALARTNASLAIPIPKAAAPIVAKSIEDQRITVEKPDEDDAEVEDDVASVFSAGSDQGSESEAEEEGDIVIAEDFTKKVDLQKSSAGKNNARGRQSGDSQLESSGAAKHKTRWSKVLSRFPAKYENIIAEFADVEIFLISVDGLLIELAAHKYLNWTLGGQTIVITKQVDRFLTQLAELGGKFKLVWFTDLEAVYAKDTVLNFLRAFVAAYLAQSCWADDIEYFQNPADDRWINYINSLTPSFLMISVDDASKNVTTNEELKFSTFLTSIAVHALSCAIRVVHFSGLAINLCSVYCHRVEPVIVDFTGFDNFLKSTWNMNYTGVKRDVDLSSCKSIVQLWAQVINKCKKSGSVSKKFDVLASAILIASLVGARRGTDRLYLPEEAFPKRGVDHITDRRQLLNACAALLNSLDLQKHPLPFQLNDLWDGRLIANIFDKINAGAKISPYRIQEELAPYHQMAGLELSLEVDMDDRLLDPVPEKKLLIDDCKLLPVKSLLLHRYAHEYEGLIAKRASAEEPLIAEFFKKASDWPFHQIEEEFSKPAEKIDDQWQIKRKNKQRQFLSRWYEGFAQSLEGRGSNLLVDFSRTPRGFATIEENPAEGKKKEKPQWQQKGKGGKAKKEPAKSKKELILEANRNKKSEKMVETEKQMVKFATQQGKKAVSFLENLMGKLELEESRAYCVYEQAVRIVRDLDSLEGNSFLELRRIRAVPVFEKLKQLFMLHWNYLDERQKDFVTTTWESLGFEKNKKRPYESKLSVGMNMVYYQLAYGGEIIDIQSDPQKDDRVTGFHPDAWQRQMLDAVDRNQSAVIIAPTSAGKTFVSYYCIEKILRQSDDDMVVYVSPSKALLNQVCGSVYARFRNKTLSGGKSLFGTLVQEYSDNAMNCQVLITVPECLEQVLLSSNPAVQNLVSKIKYVIFDEVHCISASPEAHIWEHLLLLIRCPFLALSATIGNAEVLHSWLQSAEKSRTPKEAAVRKVELIKYGERYSELELCMQRVKEEDTDGALNDETSMLEHFMPYGVYKPVKLSMFGIPDDQQLTARQILDLYYAMAEVDPASKAEFEPCRFFGYHEGGQKVWLSRANIRKLENALKDRFLEWLKTDPVKTDRVLKQLGKNVEGQLAYRSKPFDQRGTALKNIVPVIMELRDNDQLPAICFNDDRRVCEKLAERLCDYLDEQQRLFEESPEYKQKYEIKDEEKMMKLAKRKRDAKEKKLKGPKGKKGEREDEEEREPVVDEVDDTDPLAAQKMRLNQALEKFKLRGRLRDDEMFAKMKDRLLRQGGRNRDSTKMLLRLFERGIGYHHEGLNVTERGAVEILFRSGHLAIVFSTSTLALGINMPCKTVLFGVDTPQLTPLQFRQMSGRAGRRGFDHSGTVIFMSIPTAKIRRLLTASLSTLRGNLPFSTSFLLRLLTYVHLNSDELEPQLVNQKYGMSPLEVRVQTALTLLENSFVLHTRAESSAALQKEFKLFTLFSVQLLRAFDLVNEKGVPKGLASVVCHLSAHEPGNILFAHLLQNGVFHRICNQYRDDRLKLKATLVLIFAHLFTNRRLPLGWNPNDKDSYPSDGDSVVFLQPLPEDCNCRELVESYNAKVDELFKSFMQLSGPGNSLQGEVFSLAGNPDSSLSAFSHDVVRPVHDGFLFDEGLLPSYAINPVDHRGNKIYRNAYAVDFWRLGSKKALERNNNIDQRETWFLVQKFAVALEKISSALLTVGRSKDPFVEEMKELAEEYDKKFRSAFGMKAKY